MSNTITTHMLSDQELKAISESSKVWVGGKKGEFVQGSPLLAQSLIEGSTYWVNKRVRVVY